MLSSCMDRSSSGRPGASEPLRVAVCLLSDCFAVSEPISESSAYRPLAPSETARTATISQRCSQAGGGASPPGAAAGAGSGSARGVASARGAGLVRGTAGPVEMSSVIALQYHRTYEPNSPLPGEQLSSVN